LVAPLYSCSGLYLGSQDPRNAQREYVEEITSSRKELFRGDLEYDDGESLSLAVGESADFTATLRGSWEQSFNEKPDSDVYAGVQIGVTLHCSGADVKCTPLSSERQNVLTPHDFAWWRWEVTPSRNGKVTFSLTVTAYLRDTDSVLFEKAPIVLHARVNDEPTSWVSDVASWVISLP
jgi:hypothetical protein